MVCKSSLAKHATLAHANLEQRGHAVRCLAGDGSQYSRCNGYASKFPKKWELIYRLQDSTGINWYQVMALLQEEEEEYEATCFVARSMLFCIYTGVEWDK